MLLRDALKQLKFDKRLQEYNMQKGTLTLDELQSHISSLGDCQAASEPLRFKEERQPKVESSSAKEYHREYSNGGSFSSDDDGGY